MAQLRQTGSQTGLTVEGTDAVCECRRRVSMLQRESLDVRAQSVPSLFSSFTLSPRGEGARDVPVIGGQEEAMLLRWGCSRPCGSHRSLSPPPKWPSVSRHMLRNADTPTSTALEEEWWRGRVPQLHIVVERAMSVLRSQARLVLLLVLFCCGCG